MPTFNAAQVVGKTLFAKKDLAIYKLPPRPSKRTKWYCMERYIC